MPVKYLKTLDKGVHNRNTKVLKRYEASCRGFEKDYQTAMRGHRAILADDLQFAYYLLKQMEKYEDEKLTKRNVVVRCTYKVPSLKLDTKRPNSNLESICPQTDRPSGCVGQRKDIPFVRPLTAPAGRSLTTTDKKNVIRKHNRFRNKNSKKKDGKPIRSRSAPVTAHQEDSNEEGEQVPPTPIARFTRTYEYNRKVLLCRSRQEERRMERIREAEEEYENQSNYSDDKEEEDDNYFDVEEASHETRKHDYWMWKIDVLFEKWRRNDRQLEDDDIYSLYEEDLDEEIFDDNQVQSYTKPGMRQVNTLGRTKLVKFTRNKVLKYRWAFAGEGFNKSAEDNRKIRRKFITAELSHRERQKIREEAETKCRRVKKMVQESDYLRNEVYLMAPFYKTKQALIAKVAAKQPALFQ
ncbi:uncharacterized protein LOC132562246 [Ylistrum balloti]|uniref:uncharacterized protein LOC132562246 n=1 Tax=Ylistrum balloti TaxID=509963 RepID=UPI002905C337|nr:uncharacterized protein LOC132562246 [Ylistrum balloti]